jgi:hypothetical protein
MHLYTPLQNTWMRYGYPVHRKGDITTAQLGALLSPVAATVTATSTSPSLAA